MDEGKAAPAAGKDDIISLALDELRPPAERVEDEVKPEESGDLSQDETNEEESAEQSAEETSEDVEEEATEDSESSEDEDEAGEEDEAPSPDKIQKRINKLTAQKKQAAEEAAAVKSQYEEAQKRLTELEAQVNEAARPVLQPTAENPLADVDTQEALEAKIKSAQEVRRWALRNSDGATVKRPDGSEVYLDADQVKDYLIKADDVIVTHGPARQQWLAQRQPAVQAAKNLFPDIFKKGTPMHTAYQQTVKQAPELLKLPQHEYWVGLALYGEHLLMQQQAANQAKTKAAKKVSSAKATAKTPTPVKPISSPKTSTKSVSKVTRDRMLASGRLDDVADFMSEALFG
jgi:hypothetical protein